MTILSASDFIVALDLWLRRLGLLPDSFFTGLFNGGPFLGRALLPTIVNAPVRFLNNDNFSGYSPRDWAAGRNRFFGGILSTQQFDKFIILNPIGKAHADAAVPR